MLSLDLETLVFKRDLSDPLEHLNQIGQILNCLIYHDDNETEQLAESFEELVLNNI